MRALLDELESYFPDGNLEDLNISSPKRFPQANDEAAARSYRISGISSLANIFKLDEKATIGEWQTLLQSIVKSKNHCSIKRDDAEPVGFWATLLSWTDTAWNDKRKNNSTYTQFWLSQSVAQKPSAGSLC